MRSFLLWLVPLLVLGCDRPAPQPAVAPDLQNPPAGSASAPGALELALAAISTGSPAGAARAVDELAGWHPARVRHAWSRLAPALAGAVEAGRLQYSEALFELLSKAGPAGQDLAAAGLMADEPEERIRAARWFIARGDRGLRVVITALPELPDRDPGPGQVAIGALARRQADADPRERIQAAGLLRLVAEASADRPAGGDLLQVMPRGLSEVLTRLTAMSDDPDPAVRIAAIEALGELGPRAVGALPRVAERLHDPVPGVVEVAGEVIHRFGPEALGPLRRVLDDPQPHLRVLAARALGRLGQAWPGQAEALSARCLAAGTRDPDGAVRLEAYQALAGMPAAAVTDRLLAAGLRDADDRLRLEVAHLFGRRQDNPRVVEALAAALADNLEPEKESMALAVLAALGRHGRDVQAVFSHLASAARKGPAKVRAEALRLILAAGGRPKRVLDLLAEALADNAGEVRLAAVAGLGKRLPLELKMRPGAKRLRRLAARIRRMAVEDPDLDVRRVCRSLDVRLPL